MVIILSIIGANQLGAALPGGTATRLLLAAGGGGGVGTGGGQAGDGSGTILDTGDLSILLTTDLRGPHTGKGPRFGQLEIPPPLEQSCLETVAFGLDRPR